MKFAKKNGYIINVLKGYNFSREINVFKKYVEKLYNIKSNPINNTQKSMAKSLQNNLLGRFGINLEKAVTDLLTRKSFDIKSTMCKIMSYKVISDDKVLVSYLPKLDTDIIKSHGLNITKIIDKYKHHEVQNFNVSSIPISAAITAYGRIHISKIKLLILNKARQTDLLFWYW